MRPLSRRRFSALAAGTGALAASPALAKDEGLTVDERIGTLSRLLVFGGPTASAAAAQELARIGDVGAAAAMIFSMRYAGLIRRDIDVALHDLTGDEGVEGWFQWMMWQERNPQIRPHPSYVDVKLATLKGIDPNFERFLKPEYLTDEKAKIRFEEIAWGGVRVDGIPSLDKPEMIPHDDAKYLLDDDLVFGLEIDGDARAWPLRILGWHEMTNDVVGGVPIALAYCTLCGAGIVFETTVDGRDEPFIFSTSGFLYRSNKLMYDRQTDTLWNQFTGKPVIGPLVDSGIELKIRPVATTSWKAWRTAHPNGKVLSLDTGHRRDYSSGAVYRSYFASDELMFPAFSDQTNLQQKERVFGVRGPGASRAWPLKAFDGGAVINDRVGPVDLVLVGDFETRTVRAYERRGRSFEKDAATGAPKDKAGVWTVSEADIASPDGERLPRYPGHVAYWFAWNNFVGGDNTLYGVN